MKKILVFPYNQPCLDIRVMDNVSKDSPNHNVKFGLNRDRNPDRDWPELRSSRLDSAKEVEMTDELKQILLEDLAYTYGNDTNKFALKLKEFNLI